MSPASYQTAPPRDVCCVLRPALLPRAGNGTRTRDPNLGKVVLYQLSYSRSQRFTACALRPVPASGTTVEAMEVRGIEPLTS